MTFTAVLSACVNAGLVEKGRELFKLMVDRYRLEPTIHHYGCMVDLYAKAGLLEAYEVIKTMKVEPNVIIRTSLLAACKKAKDFEIAIEGMEKVLALEISDENAGLYTLISDLYAMGGRWDNVLKIRRLVEERDVWKNTRPLSTRWSPPAPGMLKINSDGAFLQDRGTGAAGAVVRDSSGNFCAASARWLGPVGSVLIAEARGDSRWLASDSTRNHGTHHRGD